MEYPREITTFQAAAIIVNGVLSLGALAIPRFSAEVAGTGAPFITIVGGIIAFIGLWAIALLGVRFPNQSIFNYSQVILGKWLGIAGGVMIVAFFAVFTAATMREFSELINAAVLHRTPIELTLILMLLAVAISSRNDMNTFAYIQLFYLLWLIPVILIHFIELKNADIINLLPPFGAGQKIWPGLLMIASFYQGFFIITIIIPAMRQRKKALKASLIGMLIATGIYCFDVITSIAVFGAEQTKQMLWPAFELAKTVSVPGNVLERLDVIYLIVWLTAVFSATLASYYLTIHGLRELIQLRDHKLFSVFLVPFIFVITLLPQDEIYFDQLIQSALPLGLIVTICYPVLLYIVAMFRGKNETTSPAKQT